MQMLAREVMWFSYGLYEMHDLSKVGENYSRDLPEVIKMTTMDNFKLSKVRKIISVTSPNIVLKTCTLLYL